MAALPPAVPGDSFHEAGVFPGETVSHLISAHITRDQPNTDRFTSLPPSIGWRIYYHRSADIYIVDVFRASRPPDDPFQTPVPTVDIPLDLPHQLNVLESIYGHLDKLGLANSFKKSYINFGLLLNRLIGMPVLSLISNDDEWDFACTTADGSLSRLKCRCGDIVITYEDGNARIQPLAVEAEDRDFLTDLDELRAALPAVSILDRDVPWHSQLHAIAIEEWQRFRGTDKFILGLGSFDLPEDEADWQLIGGS